MVNAYSFGRITIEGQTYSSDIILFPDRVDSSWWRKEGHTLSLDDLKKISFDETDAFIVGTGFFGLMKVTEEVRKFMHEKGIQLFVDKTKEAGRKYNELAPHTKIIAVFHLTC